MFTKKEKIVTIICVICGILLVYFLPTIEAFITGRKNYTYDEGKEPKKQVDKYICTYTSSSNAVSTTIDVTFTIENDTVTKMFSRESKAYNSLDSYKGALITLGSEVENEIERIKIIRDDENNTIITTKDQKVSLGAKINYPTNYKELKEYLDKNKYTCTIRYKY